MAFQCAQCASLFFKTLETRVCVQTRTVFYKKRCKRCKFKVRVKQAWPDGRPQPVTHAEWLTARKMGAGSSAARIHVSEYTRRVSQGAEQALPYLQAAQPTEAQHGPA